MPQNLVIQLLLKTGAFSSDLKQAKGQIQNFQKGCQTAGQSVSGFSQALGINVGALTKFGGAVGVAVAAGKSLKAIIESNQTTADAFEGVMYATKTAVSSLATAIGTFDFSNFQDGLSGLISRAKDAYNAIDQLGNTLMSYNVVSAKANAAVTAYRAGEKNKELSPAELQTLKANAEAAVAELRESTEVAMEDLATAIIAEANAKGAKLSGDGAMALIDEILTLDGKRVRDTVKASMKTVQDEYNKELNDLQSNFKTTTSIGGGNTGYIQTIPGVDTKNPEYQRALSDLNNRYQKLHVYNTLLEKETDDSLKKIGEQRAQIYNLEASLYTLEGKLDSTNNKINSGADAFTKKLGEEIKAQEGSLTYWKQIAQETEKHRNMEVFNSTAWLTYDKALQDALAHIRMLEAQLQRYQYQQEGKDKPLPKPANAPTGKAIPLTTTGLKMPKSATVPPNNAEEKWTAVTVAINTTASAVESMASAFQEGTKITTASILRLVSTTLPALSSLITAVATLAGVEATEKAVSTATHWIEAIAAVAALGAAVATAISASKNNKFANGGIVGGTSWTGDRVTAQVNSGEMILNKTQQANLFRLANGGMGSGKEVEFHISGTELVGVLNNVNRKNRVIR